MIATTKGDARSYASIAKQNAPPLSEQPRPDPALLATPFAQHEYHSADINIVTAAEAEAIRHAIESPPPPPEPVLLAAPVSNLPKSEPEILQTNLERIEAELLAGVKSTAHKGRKVLDDGEKRLQEDRARVKKVAEKKTEEFKKRAKQVDKETRALASRHPVAVTGLVGLLNASILATVGIFAYQNWNTRAYWDRRIVSATAVGLATVFGAQGYLGYYEYEKSQPTAK